MNKSKSKGIGLLELMLSLAIIAILLIMAIRYYQSANLSQQMSSATNMFNAVRSAMKNFYNDNAVNPNVGGAQSVSIQDLMDSGYLPPSFGVNPWGGVVAFTAIASSRSCGTKLTPTALNQTYSVCMSEVPTAACSQLQVKLQGTINTSLNEDAACDANTVTVTYSYG